MKLVTYLELTDELPSKAARAATRIMLADEQLECDCGATILRQQEIDDGKCAVCYAADACPTCGDAGSCAACAR